MTGIEQTVDVVVIGLGPGGEEVAYDWDDTVAVLRFEKRGGRFVRGGGTGG